MSDLKDRVDAALRGSGVVLGLVRDCGPGIELIRTGREHKFLCPFHDDNKPSMTLNDTKGERGIIKCFSCGAGGDIYWFYQEYHRIEFKEALEMIAGKLGLAERKGVRGNASKPVQRQTVKREPSVRTLTPQEVYGHYQKARETQVDDPAPWIEMVGLPVQAAIRALEICGAFIFEQVDRTVLCWPMRDAHGAMTSLRFRDFETKKRWSCSERKRVNGAWVQTASTRAGLLTYEAFYDTDMCIDGTWTACIEGETDLWAALCMMLQSWPDPAEWPVRFCALPGVNSCHDIFLQTHLSGTVVCGFDDDEAAHRAVFYHRPTRMVDGQRTPDLDAALQPGLLHKLLQMKKTAIAVFPPRSDEKFDLRDWVRAGLDIEAYRSYVLRYGTSNAHGRSRKDTRPTATEWMDGQGTRTISTGP
jgi:hypothetical protein